MTAMGEAQELHPPITVSGGMEREAENPKTKKTSCIPFLRKHKWWLQMMLHGFFVIAGQSVGTILGRLYFDNGGKSKWMATLVQVAGFPVLFPFLFFRATKHKVNCMLYSIGIQYLPVTTYTLVCASQLGFNALFSYFLNKQKLTPFILNSLVLLTISSVLLVFQSEPGDSKKSTKEKYVIGFVCTLAASAGYAMMLSATQLAFQKIIKKESIRAIMDMNVYQSLVATLAIVIGLFASGDWKRLSREMEVYESGKVSYVMNLVWTAVSWQVFGVGCIGLIFKVSSLFSNVISVVGLPVAPVAAVIFLGDKFTGLKAVSMVLAMWGFVSYIYQHYLDDLKMKEKERERERSSDEVSQVALVDERGLNHS